MLPKKLCQFFKVFLLIFKSKTSNKNTYSYICHISSHYFEFCTLQKSFSITNCPSFALLFLTNRGSRTFVLCKLNITALYFNSNETEHNWTHYLIGNRLIIIQEGATVFTNNKWVSFRIFVKSLKLYTF